MQESSKTDWERVQRDIESDAPITFDPEDELYDPNDDAAVDAAWSSGIVTVTRREIKEGSVLEQIWLRVPADLVERYRAQGDDWQARMDAALRQGAA